MYNNHKRIQSIYMMSHRQKMVILLLNDSSYFTLFKHISQPIFYFLLCHTQTPLSQHFSVRSTFTPLWNLKTIDICYFADCMQQQSQRGTFSTLMYFTDNQIKIKNNSNNQRNAKKKNVRFNYWLAGHPIVYSIYIVHTYTITRPSTWIDFSHIKWRIQESNRRAQSRFHPSSSTLLRTIYAGWIYKDLHNLDSTLSRWTRW